MLSEIGVINYGRLFALYLGELKQYANAHSFYSLVSPFGCLLANCPGRVVLIPIRLAHFATLQDSRVHH